jgi:hypothetical protein
MKAEAIADQIKGELQPMANDILRILDLGNVLQGITDGEAIDGELVPGILVKGQFIRHVNGNEICHSSSPGF